MHYRSIALALVIALPGLTLADLALADTVHFKNGSKMEGVTRVQGDSLEVRISEGSLYFARSLVDRIEVAEMPLQEYERRAKTLAAANPPRSDAKAAFDLGVFAESSGLKAQAQEMFRRTVASDPNHEAARERLGFKKVGGKWQTREELLAELGLVQVNGEWMSPRAARQMADFDERTRRLETRLGQMERDASSLSAALDRAQRETDRSERTNDRRIAQLEEEVDRRDSGSSYNNGYNYGYGYYPGYIYTNPVTIIPAPPTRPVVTPRAPGPAARQPFDPLPFPGIPPVGSNR